MKVRSGDPYMIHETKPGDQRLRKIVRLEPVLNDPGHGTSLVRRGGWVHLG